MNHFLEVTQGVLAQCLVLHQTQRLFGPVQSRVVTPRRSQNIINLQDRSREVVMPEEGHLLEKLAPAVDHAVQPPSLQVPDVGHILPIIGVLSNELEAGGFQPGFHLGIIHGFVVEKLAQRYLEALSHQTPDLLGRRAETASPHQVGGSPGTSLERANLLGTGITPGVAPATTAPPNLGRELGAAQKNCQDESDSPHLSRPFKQH